MKATIVVNDRTFVFDAREFELAHYTHEDLATALAATLEDFLKDVAKGRLNFWSGYEAE